MRADCIKPLFAYRAEDLTKSHECFFGADHRYHRARSRFVHGLGTTVEVTLAARGQPRTAIVA
jgi:hypothetical protein